MQDTAIPCFWHCLLPAGRTGDRFMSFQAGKTGEIPTVASLIALLHLREWPKIHALETRQKGHGSHPAELTIFPTKVHHPETYLQKRLHEMGFSLEKHVW